MTICQDLTHAFDTPAHRQAHQAQVIATESDPGSFKHLQLPASREVRSLTVDQLKSHKNVNGTPHTTRAQPITVNGNTFRSSAFWVSMASLAMSVTMLIKNW